MNLIICDDEHEAARELSEFLQDYGIATRLAPNMTMAQQEILAASPPICVITNMRMPGGNGSDLVRWIRQEAPDGKRLAPTILVSGDSEQLDETQKASLDLFDLRLRKPLALEELLTALRDLGIIA